LIGQGSEKHEKFKTAIWGSQKQTTKLESALKTISETGIKLERKGGRT
jgi:hypothetical protein